MGLLVALLGALFGAGLVFATSASAHATVVSSDPTDGARLKQMPRTVTITFDEPVTLGNLGYLRVTDQSGRRVDTGKASHPGGDDTKIVNTLKPGLGDGTYTESFRIISADSHPVAGVVRFVVGNGVLTATSVSTSTVDGVTSKTFGVARWVSYAGFALLGGVWLFLTVWPSGRDDRRARKIVWTGWGLAVAGACAELVLQGPYVAGEGLSKLTTWALLDGTLHTNYGQFHCGRLVLLGAIAVLLGWSLQGASRRRARFEDALWPMLIGVALTFSAIGHADTTNPRWLSISADVLHLCAMSAWVGGLVLLVGAVLPRRDPAELRVVLPAFSRVAFTAVVTLAVTGIYAAWRGVGELRAIFGTNYGLLVCTKIVLFLGLIAVGNMSRQTVQRRLVRLPVAYAMADPPEPALERDARDALERDTREAADTAGPASDGTGTGDEDALDHERMRRSVLVEIALAVLVLLATSVLVDQPRGREALAAQDRQPVAGTAQLGGGRSVTITLEPGVHGVVTASLALSEGTQPQQITATALQPERQIGPIPLKLAPNGKNLYGASDLNLPVSGTWEFTVVVTTSKFDAVTVVVNVHLN